MDTSDVIAGRSFERVERIDDPGIDGDWATTFLDTDEDRVIVQGHLVDGDTRADVELTDIRIARGDADELVLQADVAITKDDVEAFGPIAQDFTYNLDIRFKSGVIPRYEIRHFDDEGEKQYETTKIYAAYLEDD